MKKTLCFLMSLVMTFSLFIVPFSGAASANEMDGEENGIQMVDNASALNAPVMKSLSVDKDSGDMIVSWKAVTGLKSGDVYRVYKRVGSNSFKKLADTKDTSITDDVLSNGKEYAYKVRVVAKDGRFKSPFSEIKTLKYAPAPYMSQLIMIQGDGGRKIASGVKKTDDGYIANRKAAAETATVKVQWYPVDGVSYYSVYRREGTKAWQRIVEKTKKLSVTDKPDGYPDTKKYDYAVRCLDEDGTPISKLSVSANKTRIFTCIAVKSSKCYESAKTSSAKLCDFAGGDKVTVIGKTGDFYKVMTPSGKAGYMLKSALSETGKVVGGQNQRGDDEKFVAYDLRAYLPDAEFSITFANASAEHNPTGKALYKAVPILEEGTAKKLKKACEQFEKDGYRVKIYEAYRPSGAQEALYSAVKDPSLVAPPVSYGGSGSYHQLGIAIDMSIIDKSTGEEIRMPSAMHEFDKNQKGIIGYGHVSSAQPKSWFYTRYHLCALNSAWDSQLKANVNYMASVMADNGFELLQTEWWHFQNTVNNQYSGSVSTNKLQNPVSSVYDIMLNKLEYAPNAY